MKKSRLLAAVGYLVIGMWLGSSSLDGATAQSPSLTFPLKLGKTQPPMPSSTPRPDADLEAMESKSFLTPPPISPACPFPPIPLSETTANTPSSYRFGTVTRTSTVEIEGFSRSIEQGDGGKITITTQSEGRETFVTFVQGDGSDPDLDWTVNNLVRTGKLDEALQVAQKIKDVSLKNKALIRIVRAYKEAEQLDRAFEVATSLTEPPKLNDASSEDNSSVKADVLSEIAEAYIQAGQLDKALQVAEIMGKDIQFFTLLRVTEEYKGAGQLDLATEVIDRLAAAYRTLAIPDSTAPESAAYSNASTLLAIANQYASVGRTDQAVELLPEISELTKTLPRQNCLTVNVLSGTAQLYAMVGQRERAAEVLSDALQVVENIEETFVKASALTQIANGYAELKQPDRATELLSQVLELAKSENGITEKNVILIMLARGYGVLGHFDQAFQVTNAVEPTALRDQVKQTLECSREAR